MNANCFALRATSAIRSVPLQWLVEVSATSAPQLKAASAMRISSVATITESRFFARFASLPYAPQKSFASNQMQWFSWKTRRTPARWNDAYRLIHGSHPERSEAKSKDPARLISGKAAGLKAWPRDFVRCVAASTLLGMTEDHDFAFKMIWTAAGTSSATQSALLPVTSR